VRKRWICAIGLRGRLEPAFWYANKLTRSLEFHITLQCDLLRRITI
jgi:hypothetical protein